MRHDDDASASLAYLGDTRDVEHGARADEAADRSKPIKGRRFNLMHANLANEDSILRAKRLGMVCCPGVATPTEAFAALAVGADGLKMFPAEALPPAALRAWRAVLPKETLVFAVGGIRPDNMQGYWSAGASGFGTGSNLYKPGTSAEDVAKVAREYATTFTELKR